MSFDYRFQPPSIAELEEMNMSECPYDTYCEGEFDCGSECKFYEGENMDYIKMSLKLNEELENEFNPLYWIDITDYDDGTNSISLLGPSYIEFSNEESEDTMKSFNMDAFSKAEDEFFDKMDKVKEFISNKGYKVDLNKNYADCDSRCAEATFCIDFTGGEL